MTLAEPTALPPPPTRSGGGGAVWEASRQVFRYGNRWVVVPLHRAGLAAWLGTPLTGWQLLLTTTGRRSGRRRHTPLGYVIMDGAAWVLAGYGPGALWYRNLLADPRVELLLPGRAPRASTAAVTDDAATRRRVIPALVRSMRLPGAMVGCDPGTASDERLLELTAWVPLVRIRPDGPALLPGPDDPGGLGWVWRQSVLAILGTVGLGAIRRLIRR